MIRKNYFILRGMQTRFILTVLLIGFLVLSVVAFNIYVFHGYFQNEILSLAEDTQLYVMLEKAWAALWWRILLLVAVTAFIAVFLTLLFSHQIAGPVFKITRNLELIKNGRLDVRVKLRKYDELNEIADAVNDMCDEVGQRIMNIRHLSESADSADATRTITLIKDELEFFTLPAAPDDPEIPADPEPSADTDDPSTSADPEAPANSTAPAAPADTDDPSTSADPEAPANSTAPAAPAASEGPRPGR